MLSSLAIEYLSYFPFGVGLLVLTYAIILSILRITTYECYDYIREPLVNIGKPTILTLISFIVRNDENIYLREVYIK